MMRLVLLSMMALVLAGCAASGTHWERTHKQTVTDAQLPVTGTDGTVTLVTARTVVDETVTTDGGDQRTSGPDAQRIADGVRQVGSAAVQVASGGINLSTIIGAGTALLGATGAAWAARGPQLKQLRDQIETHKADAAEGWAKSEQHAARAESYARQLPPESA